MGDLKRKAVLLFLLFLFLTMPFCDGEALERETEYPQTAAAAREVLWEAISSGVSSATVAVMDGGKIVYSECFGPADRAENRLVDTNTRFNIGSTSKMFAAVAILLLVDEGKLDLDDPVVRYIPEFTMPDERYRNITVRMLFNHSSGLPGTTFLFGKDPGRDLYTLLLDNLKETYLKHDPGAMSIYCNDGFTLAEMIVERLSAQKYMDFLDERIFKPLGMKNTGPSIGERGGNVAEYYDPANGKKYPLETVLVHAAGGLSSTPEDLCRFGDSMAPGGNNILSRASLEELMKEQPTTSVDWLKGNALYNSFGWEHAWLPYYRDRGYQVLGKGGNTVYYSTGFQILPSERIAVAVMIGGQASGEGLTTPILDALMEDKGFFDREAQVVAKPVKPQPIPSGMLPFAGYYVDEKTAVQFVFDQKKQTLNIYPMLPCPPEGNGERVPALVLTYHNGYFHNFERKMRCYFLVEEGNTFLVVEKIPVYGSDVWIFQKLEEIEDPVKLSVEMDGSIWLVRNMPAPTIVDDDPFMTRSSLNRDLPGYLSFYGVLKIDHPDHASIAATAFRDQRAIRIFRKKGEVRIRTGLFIFSDENAARPVEAGVNNVVIGAEGENEWMKVETGAILSFKKPHRARVLVMRPGNGNQVFYDSVVDSGETYAPPGSFVFLAGSPGDTFEIKAR